MEETKPLFSLIIPCHNPDKTIERLFHSLSKQYIPKEDLEIIVVDDNSNSLDYREKIKNCYYKTIFSETNTNIHCPGNTRRKGMEDIHGQWVFFCDQDDYFEDEALKKVKAFILREKPKYVVSTIMRGYNENNQQFNNNFQHKTAWLHGKFYSMDNLITPYNINFKKDLVTHEDIYFNSCILSILFSLHADYNYLNINTYRWIDNPESLTRKPTSDRGYLYENFQDYIISASEPYWEKATKQDPIFLNQVMMTLLHGYFYYEAASYYYGPDNYKDIIQLLKNFVKKILNEIHLTLNDIIDFVYYDPKKYWDVMQDCMMFSGNFIPKTSFRDFVYYLGKEN